MGVTVKRTGKTWSVFVQGVLVEGGFFCKDYAIAAAQDWIRHGMTRTRPNHGE